MQFRTKARAVDLLGKGQIADLPTAITELWKNGYDAYADKLEARIYLSGYKGLKNPMFVITDDGKGMSRREIFEKWLVLGTDSKSRNTLEENESIETLWKKPRIKSGEKGIGRLSVAFLGSPMLMLTKKRGHGLQALFFDWRLLENYNLFLDAVEIPVVEIQSAKEFRFKFEELKKGFLLNFENEKDAEGNQIWEKFQNKLKNDIINSVNNIEIPSFFEEEMLKGMLAFTSENGTKFVIFEPINQIVELTKIKTEKEDDINDNEFVLSSLSGFTNEFKKDEGVNINTSVPIHDSDSGIYDFLKSRGEFFNPKDFDLADIVISGYFDGKGSFKGTLTVFDEDFPYTNENLRKKDFRNIDYGEFSFKLGVVQGKVSESKLESKVHTSIWKKIDLFGGLYLYRDNFRVLPYGRSNHDFLDFEYRRSKSVGGAFFSHRRMYGFIDLTRLGNSKLKDKSSREGLINNVNFRAFKSDLKQFFIILAKEYFGNKAKKKSVFLDRKEEIKRQKEEIKKDKEREKQEKRIFTLALKKLPEKFKNYQNNYQDLLIKLSKKIDSDKIVYSNIEYLLGEIQKLDIEYKNLLPQIPKRYKPNESQLDRLNKFEIEIISFNETIKRESKALQRVAKSKLEVQDLIKEFENTYLNYGGALEKQIFEKREELNTKFKAIEKEFAERSSLIIKELEFEKNNISQSIATREDVIDGIEKISELFEILREQTERELFPMVNHIKRLDFEYDEERLQGAYKAEYEAIKYQWEQTRDVAQLGIAVEIIDHEFNQLYSKINHSIDRLNANKEVKDIPNFEFLKKNFTQLEDKYALLSPLYRVSGIVARDIKCESIYGYLARFFQAKLQDENIEYSATNSFKKHVIKIKEPVIHTVFINLINNAIYWLRNAEDKKIVLDYLPSTKEILVMNSGVKIETHKLEKIFELFYSNKPSGRGIGLYLSKQSLVENYFDLYATNDLKYNKLNGACFVITLLK